MASENERADQGRTRENRSDGPGIIVFSRRLRWVANLKKVINVVVLGSPDFPASEEATDHVTLGESARRKQLSSIEVDPDAENSQYRPGTSVDSSADSNRGESGFCSWNFRRCFSMRGYAFVVASMELLGLLYLMATSVVIYTRDGMWPWFFQPFIAPLWFRHPSALFGTISGFCIAGLAGVVCLMQALDGNRWSPKLMIPHLLLQILTIFVTLIFSLIAIILLMTKGTFALRILDLAGSSLGNGIVGIGNILLGLERGQMATRAAENILLNAGISSAPVLRQEILSNMTAIVFQPTPASSVVHYNMFGAIWEAFNYEIAMIVAVLVFGTICVTEIFAWLLVRQLYVSSVVKLKRRETEACANVRNRRRYNSGSTPV